MKHLLCVFTFSMTLICSFTSFSDAHNRTQSFNPIPLSYQFNAIPSAIKNTPEKSIAVARRGGSASRTRGRGMRMRYGR
jgi:hypothetical protein